MLKTVIGLTILAACAGDSGIVGRIPGGRISGTDSAVPAPEHVRAPPEQPPGSGFGSSDSVRESVHPARARITGTLTDREGRPLKNAWAQIRGVTDRGENVGFKGDIDGTGRYSVDLPPGRYSVRAVVQVYYEGRTWYLDLHPTDNVHNEISPQGEVVKNFQWLVAGFKPGGDPEAYLSYYGAAILIAFSGGSFYSMPQPEQQLVELTLTPTGPLIDGSQGALQTSRVSLSQLLQRPRVWDIPIGSYRATARFIRSDGARFRLLLRPEFGRPGSDQWQHIVGITFEPSTMASPQVAWAAPTQLHINTESATAE
jgi:hypothetical protein